MSTSGQLVVRFLGDTRGLDRAISGAQGRTSALGKTLVGAAAGFVAATAGAAAFVYKVGAPYTAALAKIQTLGDANDATMQKVTSTLEGQTSAFAKLGMTTGDAAGAMVELVKAGMSVDQALAAVKDTMVLAAAGEMDIADAAALTSNTLNVFKLRAQDAGRVANVLANAANASSIDVSDMAFSLQMAGNVAAGAHLSIEQTSALLAQLGQNGLKGSDGGTSLKTMLLSLQAPSDSAKKKLSELNLAIYDANGTMRPFRDILGTMSTKFRSMSEASRNAAMKTIFGADAIRAAKVIMQGGTKEYDRYMKAVEKAGAAQAMAETNTKGLAGTIARVKAIVISTAQAFYREFEPAINQAIQPLADAFEDMAMRVVPAARAMAKWIKSDVAPAFTRLDETGTPVLARVQASVQRLVPVVMAWANTFRTVVLPAAMQLTRYLAGQLGPVLADVAGIVDRQVIPILRDVGVWFYTKVVPAVVATARVWAAKLQPAFEAAVRVVRKDVLPAVERAMVKFREWWPTISKVAMVVLQVTARFGTMSATILGKVLPPVLKFIGFMWQLSQPIRTAITWVQLMVDAFGAFFRSARDAGTAIGRFATAVSSKVGEALGVIRGIPGKVTSAVGNLGSTLYYAGRAVIQGLIDGILSMLGPLGSALSRVTQFVKDNKGPIEKDKILLQPAGVAIMEGLIKGITAGGAPLKRALEKVTALFERQREKLKTLISRRNDFAAGFQSFTSSVFGADFTNAETGKNEASVEKILAAQEAERRKAVQLKRDVDKLLGMGLSDDLIRQLQAEGEAGIANIHALAQGSKADIAKLNASNAATKQALKGAGMDAANELFLEQIKEQREQVRTTRQVLNTLKAIERRLGKDAEYAVIKIDGRELVVAIKKEERRTGKRHLVDS